MKERFLTRSAVMILLVREQEGCQQVLLQKRMNTGYMDGYYDFSASGHVEKGESMTQACIRETKEEIGVTIDPNDLEAMCFIHKKSEDQNDDIFYYNGYFKISNWKETPSIKEPQKCSQLQWFNIDSIPDNLIEDRKLAIQNDIHKIFYDEIGWNVEN